MGTQSEFRTPCLPPPPPPPRAPSNLVLDAEGRNDGGNFPFSSGIAMAVRGIEKIESGPLLLGQNFTDVIPAAIL